MCIRDRFNCLPTRERTHFKNILSSETPSVCVDDQLLNDAFFRCLARLLSKSALLIGWKSVNLIPICLNNLRNFISKRLTSGSRLQK